jgi:hypothetical protein
MACSNCNHVREMHLPGGGIEYECRCSSPTKGDRKAVDGSDATWPLVSPDDNCGDWLHRLIPLKDSAPRKVFEHVVRIEDATASHCIQVGMAMREGDRLECAAGDMPVRKAVWRSFRRSLIARAGFIDDELAAVYGIGGDTLGDVGLAWMFTTPVADKHPLTFVRAIKTAVHELLEVKPQLEGYVHADYTKACRMLEMVGFSLGPAEPHQKTGAPFRKFTMSAEGE